MSEADAEIISLQNQMRAVKHMLKQHQRDLALITEYLRTKRPLDLRDFEAWSERQSTLWDAAEQRAEQRMAEAEHEILDSIKSHATSASE